MLISGERSVDDKEGKSISTTAPSVLAGDVIAVWYADHGIGVVV